MVDDKPFALLWYLPGYNTLFCECSKGHHASVEIFHGNGSKFKVKPDFPYIQVLIFGRTFGISLKN